MSLRKVGGSILSFLGILLFGGIIYQYFENWSFLDAIYFSAVTITTLGYGDLVPITTTGKLFTIIFSISGIALGLYILTVIGKSFFDMELKKWGGKKITTLKKNKIFNVSKLSIGDDVLWKGSSKDKIEGSVSEIGVDYIKIHVMKNNGQLLPKKDQKILIITTKGKSKKL